MKYSLVLQSEARKLFIFSFQSPSRVNRGCSKPSQPPPPEPGQNFTRCLSTAQNMSIFLYLHSQPRCHQAKHHLQKPLLLCSLCIPLLTPHPSMWTRRLDQLLHHWLIPSFRRQPGSNVWTHPSPRTRPGWAEKPPGSVNTAFCARLLSDSPRQLGPLWLLAFCPK